MVNDSSQIQLDALSLCILICHKNSLGLLATLHIALGKSTNMKQNTPYVQLFCNRNRFTEVPRGVPRVFFIMKFGKFLISGAISLLHFNRTHSVALITRFLTKVRRFLDGEANVRRLRSRWQTRESLTLV